MDHRTNPSYWEKCLELTATTEWQPKAREPLFTHSRSVTWAEYPYRYKADAFGIERRNILRRSRIVPLIFRVSMLSALRDDTGLREYRQYFVLQPPRPIHVVAAEVGSLDDPRTGEQMARNLNFTLDNGLSLANELDTLDLGFILDRALDDGVEPYTTPE